MRNIRDYRKSDPSTYYYRVFCMAMQMGVQAMDCDVAWENAEQTYIDFYNSEFYALDIPEIDAMNEYLSSKKKDPWKQYTEDINEFLDSLNDHFNV